MVKYICRFDHLVDAKNEQEAIQKFLDFLNDKTSEFDVEVAEFDPELTYHL